MLIVSGMVDGILPVVLGRYDKFPYYKEAISLGYSLHSHGGTTDNPSYASYVKNGLFLDVWHNNTRGLQAKLSYVFLPAITSIQFSLPNKNFAIFEERMMRDKEAIEMSRERGEPF